MCNLYNLTTNQQAIRDIVGVMSDSLGNLEPSLDVYPDRISLDHGPPGRGQLRSWAPGDRS